MEQLGGRLRWVADRRKVHVAPFQKALVGVGVFIDAHAQDHSIARRNPLLQGYQRGSLFHARPAPAGPEIQDHHLPAKVG